MSIFDLLAVPASIFPDDEALVAGDRRLSYSQLADEVERLADALRADGLGDGSVIASLDVNSVLTAVAPCVAARLGAVHVPLNYRARADELAYMLLVARADVILASPRYAGVAIEAARAGEQTVPVVVVDDVSGRTDRSGPRPSARSATDPDLAVLMFTSGTTSRPKAVEFTHDQLSGYVFETTSLPEQPTGTTLLTVPLYHVAGLTALLASIFGGRRIVLLPQFDPASWLEHVERERVTHAFLVPTMLRRVLEHPQFARTDLASLRVLSYGAAPMSPGLIQQAIMAFPGSVDFVNAFGQTETTSTVTMLLPEDHRLDGPPEVVERKVRRLSSVGRALPAVRLAILGEDGTPRSSGEVGEVAIESTRSMRGYREPEGRTAGPPGWLLTGDLGYLDDEGYLFLTGRKRNIIIRGGENIAAEEVESTLASHAGVEAAAVVGLPDSTWGEIVAAAVVLRPGADVTPDDLRDHCHGRIASFKKPEEIRIVDSLPLGPMGKVVRSELLQLFSRPTSDR